MCEHYYDFKKEMKTIFGTAVQCIFFASAHNASKNK